MAPIWPALEVLLAAAPAGMAAASASPMPLGAARFTEAQRGGQDIVIETMLPFACHAASRPHPVQTAAA